MRPLDAIRAALLSLALTIAGLNGPSAVTAAAASPFPALDPPRIDPGGPTLVDEPVASPDVDQKADEALRTALELERQRKWSAAIDLYEDALKKAPGRVDLRHRLRLCEAHYRLGRRYGDRSFHEVLLRLPSDQALGLYDEILERIASHYVEPVAVQPLVRRGLDNLEVALRDQGFLQANAPNIDRDVILRLRADLRDRRERLSVADREGAKREAVAACELARDTAGIRPAAVLLEFAFGACDMLDDYSNYLTPAKLDDLFAMIDGNFVGLGVELKLDPAGLLLVSVIRGGPAWEAGLHSGDTIVAVDGRATGGLGLDEAAGRLQGEEGSRVQIVVRHPNGSEQELALTRRHVEVQSVAESKIVDPAAGVGYIQLIGFQKSSTDELREAIDELNRQGMRYLVLDLRGNPGGLLNIAVEMADGFLAEGVIVSTRGRAAGQSAVYRAHPDLPWRMPMSVLVDHDSASASEILAGALKDHGRATIIGERSYGKGSVQSIFPLKTTSAGLKLTTAKFFSPTDRAYSERGVEPDLPVRVAARPALEEGGTASSPAIGSLGDPQADLVLKAAVREARRRMAVAETSPRP